MKQIALSEIKDNLPRFLREAATEQIVITRHGRPAGILLGFASEDDWIDYRLEHDPVFLDRVARARESIQANKGVRLEDLNAALQRTEVLDQTLPPTGGDVVPPTSSQPPSRQPRVGRARRASS